MSYPIFNHLPVVPLRVTSKFGKRNTGIKGASTDHKGIDLGRDFSRAKTPIYCVKDGTVVQNQWNDYRGWFVVIQHENYNGKTVKTLYQHLAAQSSFKVGTKVKAGQEIGIMGASANPKKLKITQHLHFELQLNNIPVDPLPSLQNIVEVEDLTREETLKVIQEVLGNTDKNPSTWAKKYWDEAVKVGLLDGTKPHGYVTREQLARVVMDVIKIMEKKK